MTPKEAAEKILGHFISLTPNTPLPFHKQCALLAVTMVQDSCLEMFNDIYKYGPYFCESKYAKHLEEVKQEIEKL